MTVWIFLLFLPYYTLPVYIYIYHNEGRYLREQKNDRPLHAYMFFYNITNAVGGGLFPFRAIIYLRINQFKQHMVITCKSVQTHCASFLCHIPCYSLPVSLSLSIHISVTITYRSLLVIRLPPTPPPQKKTLVLATGCHHRNTGTDQPPNDSPFLSGNVQSSPESSPESSQIIVFLPIFHYN